MNKLIKLDDLEYPVSIAEFKRRHRNVSFPSQIPFESFGYAVVFPIEKPATTILQRLVEGQPNLTVLGTYETSYTVVDTTIGMPQADLDALANQVREARVAEIKTIAAAKELEDITLGGITFRTNDLAVAEITAATSLMGRSVAETIDFRNPSGWATATKLNLEGVQDAIWAQKKATRAAHRAHEEALSLITSPQELVDYDTSVGW